MQQRLEAVHRYWFGSSDDDLEVAQQQGKLWFGKDDEVDRQIRERFADLVELAAEQCIERSGLTPRLQLAVILLLDQFTRNIYRGDPRSFASDPLARSHAEALICGGEEALRPIERVFLYLPLEHSEDLADQQRSLMLFRQLERSVAQEQQELFGGFTDYALRHQEIIARFGRFPHRNQILKRESTAEELAFLAEPGSSF